MNDQKNTLFSEYNMNGLNLKNRVVMAPMTRNFSPNGIPKDYAPTYYARRAQGGVGLILTEGVEVNSGMWVELENQGCLLFQKFLDSLRLDM